MKAMRNWRWIAATIAVAGMVPGASLRADVVELDNGSRLVGTVRHVADGKCVVKTDFAGELTLDMSRVKRIETTEPVHVALPDGRKVLGKIAPDADGRSRIEAADGPVRVPVTELTAVWRRDGVDPTLPKPRSWKYEIFADLTGKSGNSEKFRFGGGAKAILEGPADRLKLYVQGARAQDDGDKTEDEVLGGIDYEQRISGKNSWYVRTEFERDTVEGVDFRGLGTVGYGYYFIDEEHWKLRGRAGIQYRYEDYDDGDSSSDIALELGLNHRLRLSDWADLVTDITYTPAIDDFSDYRLTHETSLDIPLGHSDIWKLRLGVSNEYNTEASDDRDRLDTTYFVRLVMNWGK